MVRVSSVPYFQYMNTETQNLLGSNPKEGALMQTAIECYIIQYLHDKEDGPLLSLMQA